MAFRNHLRLRERFGTLRRVICLGFLQLRASLGMVCRKDGSGSSALLWDIIHRFLSRESLGEMQFLLELCKRLGALIQVLLTDRLQLSEGSALAFHRTGGWRLCLHVRDVGESLLSIRESLSALASLLDLGCLELIASFGILGRQSSRLNLLLLLLRRLNGNMSYDRLGTTFRFLHFDRL